MTGPPSAPAAPPRGTPTPIATRACTANGSSRSWTGFSPPSHGCLPAAASAECGLLHRAPTTSNVCLTSYFPVRTSHFKRGSVEFILRERHPDHPAVRAAARADDARGAELVRAQLQPDEHRRGDAGRVRPEQRALPDGDQLLGHGGVVRAERRNRREDVQRRQRRAARRLGEDRAVHRGVPREDGESRVSHQPRAAGDEGPRRQRPVGSAARAFPRDGRDQPPVSLAAISLCALILALALSCTTTVNVGVLAIVLAWIVGVYFGGMPVEQIIGGFPSSLFLTLAGLTLLFAQAQVNGTLDRLTHRAVRGAAGAPGVIPFIFFGLTFTLASIGPGHIAATALMAPLAMAAAGRYKISPFLMAIMVANGASAGSLSPIAPTGVVVEGITMKMGLIDVRWTIFLNNFIAHTTIAWAGYLLLGGWRLLLAPRTRLRQGYGGQEGAPNGTETAAGPAASESIGRQIADDRPLEWRHWLTCAVILMLITGVIVFNINVGLGAFAGAVVLTLARAANEKAAVQAMPWGVIVMVCGVTLLVSLLERTGGMALFADFLGRLATPETSTAAAAFFSGVISLYSSTIGVVLPALLPTIPKLIEQMGGGDALALVSSMIIGGHLVDVSPLSTLGALCLAAAPPGTDTRALFNKLLAWGLSMTVVAALVCWVFFGL